MIVMIIVVVKEYELAEFLCFIGDHNHLGDLQ